MDGQTDESGMGVGVAVANEKLHDEVTERIFMKWPWIIRWP